MNRLQHLAVWIGAFAFIGLWMWACAHFDRERFAVEAQDEAQNRAWVAHQVCGENAAWRWNGDDLQCLTHSGRRTGKPTKVASK